VTVAGRRMIRCAGMAWLRRNIVRKDWTRNQAKRGTSKRRKDGERLWKSPECNNVIRDRSLRQQLQGRMRLKNPGLRQQLRGKIGIKNLSDRCPLYVRRKRATVIDIGGWSSRQLSPTGRRVSTYSVLKKNLELEFVKRTRGISSCFRKIRKWALWSGKAPPKRKKKSRTE
jgi:hypothetical protein